MSKPQDLRRVIQSRLIAFRGALGLSQSGLAALIGRDQAYLSRLETHRTIPKTFDRARELCGKLASDLAAAGPDGLKDIYRTVARGRESFGRMPEEHSPLARHLKDLPLWSEAVFTGSVGEWSQISNSLPFHSVAPWRGSELLQRFGARTLGLGALSGSAWQTAALKDEEVHGLGYVRAFFEQALGAWPERELSARRALAKTFGAFILLKELETGYISRINVASDPLAYMADFFGEHTPEHDEPMSFGKRSSTEFAGAVGPYWATAEEDLWLPGMEFLAAVLAAARGPKGELCPEKVRHIDRACKAYQETKDDRTADLLARFEDARQAAAARGKANGGGGDGEAT